MSPLLATGRNPTASLNASSARSKSGYGTNPGRMTRSWRSCWSNSWLNTTTVLTKVSRFRVSHPTSSLTASGFSRFHLVVDYDTIHRFSVVASAMV